VIIWAPSLACSVHSNKQSPHSDYVTRCYFNIVKGSNHQTRLETGSSLNVTPLSNILHIVKISYKYIEVQQLHFVLIFKAVNVNDAMNIIIQRNAVHHLCLQVFGIQQCLLCTNVCLESIIYYYIRTLVFLYNSIDRNLSIFFDIGCVKIHVKWYRVCKQDYFRFVIVYNDKVTHLKSNNSRIFMTS